MMMTILCARACITTSWTALIISTPQLSAAFSIETTPTTPSSHYFSQRQTTSIGIVDVRSIPSFEGVGITSILPVPSSTTTDDDDEYYYVGTKRGKVKRISLPATNNLQEEAPLQLQSQSVVRVHDIEDANGKIMFKPYPIFSMMSVPTTTTEDEESHDLMTGGGDRYATVWRREAQLAAEHDHDVVWKAEERLGPHTGWVKDLASCKCQSKIMDSTKSDYSSHCAEDNETLLIFSIGCNYIEVWSSSMEENAINVNGDGPLYRHEQKLQIDSSVKMGCTLSSDLLCLATYTSAMIANIGGTAEEDDDDDDDDDFGQPDVIITNYLLAGGVDGRIHRWEIRNNKEIFNSGVISAHDGRVNAMAVCKEMNVLISVGNDGCVHCRLMEEGTDPFEWKVASVELRRSHNTVVGDYGRDEGTQRRKITSMCIVREESTMATIAVGTSCGQIELINIVKSEDENNTLQASLFLEGDDNNIPASSIGSEEGTTTTVIHALCSKRYDDEFCRILIGHSGGLSVMDLYSLQQ